MDMDILEATFIDHVNMMVKNLEETLKFYRDLFDFQIKQENNPNKFDVPSIIIGNDSIKLCLYEDPRMKPEGGISHFGFHIANFNDVLKKCKELEIKILYGGIVEWEKSKSVYIEDPNGYEIELSKVVGGGLQPMISGKQSIFDKISKIM